jgi:hypothetical protein
MKNKVHAGNMSCAMGFAGGLLQGMLQVREVPAKIPS